MSFSNEVKKEINGRPPGPRHCLLAETAAILIHCGRVEQRGEDPVLSIETDQHLAAERFVLLVQEAFGCEVSVEDHPEHVESWKKYLVKLHPGQDSRKVLQAVKMEAVRGRICEQDLAASTLLLMSTCCKRSFLAGSFLCCGTMSTPEKNYHLEFVCTGENQAAQLVSLMKFFSLAPGMVRRKSNYIVYIKEGGMVSDMLNIMQATVSLLEYENIRIKRELRGNINRKVNCEAANISKTVTAAVDQIRDIELIRDTVGLDSLTPSLRETASMRLEYPDIALRELGALMNPPVGKSGMNHRFSRLKQIAEDIRANKEE